MNAILTNQIKQKHQELSYVLNKLFERRLFDDSPLNDFYKEVKLHLPVLTENSSKALKNYYAFINLSYGWISSAIEDSDRDFLNRTLNKILNESLLILEEY